MKMIRITRGSRGLAWDQPGSRGQKCVSQPKTSCLRKWVRGAAGPPPFRSFIAFLLFPLISLERVDPPDPGDPSRKQGVPAARLQRTLVDPPADPPIWARWAWAAPYEPIAVDGASWPPRPQQKKGPSEAGGQSLSNPHYSGNYLKSLETTMHVWSRRYT